VPPPRPPRRQGGLRQAAGILIDDLSISPLDISGPGELVLRVQELAKRLGEIRDLYRLGMRIVKDTPGS